MVNKILFFLLMGTVFAAAQMPNIQKVWLNHDKTYSGSIDKNEILQVKITLSEQDKIKDQEYFISGYSLVKNLYKKLEGKIKIIKYKDTGKKGTVFGTYEWAEENKGPHSGLFSGKFSYTFRWNSETQKIEKEKLKFTGNWQSYDKKLHLPTELSTHSE